MKGLKPFLKKEIQILKNTDKLIFCKDFLAASQIFQNF